jgi:hypothetical protein
MKLPMMEVSAGKLFLSEEEFVLDVWGLDPETLESG